MIRQRHILVPHPGHRRHHLLRRKPPVAPVAVQMQIPPQVALRHQNRQPPGPRRLQLLAPAPQLRRNPWQPQTMIKRRLLRKPLRNPGRRRRNPVLIQRQPLPIGKIPQPDIVLLTAGEILQHRPHTLRLPGPQVNLYPRLHHHRCFGIPLRQRFPHRRQTRQCLPRAAGVIGNRNQINIPDRFLPPPQRPRRCQADQPRHGVKKLRRHRRADLRRHPQRRPVGTHPLRPNLLQNLLGRLLPHPRQPGQTPVQSGGFQLCHRCNPQLQRRRPHRFRPHPRHFQQRQRPGRRLCRQPFVGCHLPGGHILQHLRADGLAHPGDFPQLGGLRTRQRPAQLVNRLRRPLVGAYLKHRIALNLQQRRHLAEQPRQFPVGNRPCRIHTAYHTTRRPLRATGSVSNWGGLTPVAILTPLTGIPYQPDSGRRGEKVGIVNLHGFTEPAKPQ